MSIFLPDDPQRVPHPGWGPSLWPLVTHCLWVGSPEGSPPCSSEVPWKGSWVETWRHLRVERDSGYGNVCKIYEVRNHLEWLLYVHPKQANFNLLWRECCTISFNYTLECIPCKPCFEGVEVRVCSCPQVWEALLEGEISPVGMTLDSCDPDFTSS